MENFPTKFHNITPAEQRFLEIELEKARLKASAKALVDEGIYDGWTRDQFNAHIENFDTTYMYSDSISVWRAWDEAHGVVKRILTKHPEFTEDWNRVFVENGKAVFSFSDELSLIDDLDRTRIQWIKRGFTPADMRNASKCWEVFTALSKEAPTSGLYFNVHTPQTPLFVTVDGERKRYFTLAINSQTEELARKAIKLAVENRDLIENINKQLYTRTSVRFYAEHGLELVEIGPWRAVVKNHNRRPNQRHGTKTGKPRHRGNHAMADALKGAGVR